jgi:hypothetical protein
MADNHMHTRRKIIAKAPVILLAAAFNMIALTAQADTAMTQQNNALHDAALIMVEQDGCVYCARWDTEISQIYPKTPEGHFAPLRRIDLHAPRPNDITFDGPLVITPTFVLTIDGQETARIEGYGGDELFWSMLTVTLQNNTNFSMQDFDIK